MAVNQRTVILNSVVSTPVAAGGTLSFPYVPPLVQADLLVGQTVYIEVYARVFSGLVTAIGASAATVTWPAGAPYPLPIGTYAVSFQTTMPQGLPSDVQQAAHLAALAGAADLPTAVAGINAIIANLIAAKLMK